MEILEDTMDWKMLNAIEFAKMLLRREEKNFQSIVSPRSSIHLNIFAWNKSVIVFSKKNAD